MHENAGSAFNRVIHRSLPRLILSRLAQALATAALLATLCFGLVHALPGDLATRVAMARVGDDRLTAAAAERIRQEEGLDWTLLAQYGAWMARLATGDLGRSLVSRKPVSEELWHHGQYTLQLGLVGWLLSYVIALPLGIAAGFRPGGMIDRATSFFALLLASLPTFLIGIGLISFFALTLRWLPPAGFRTSAHMVLPALSLALGLAAYSVRIIRDAVVAVRAAFFMTFARLKGHSPARAFLQHGVRNAAIPVVVYAALQFAYVIDGFVVIETLFNYPGIGELLVKALIARDAPVIMGAGIVIGLAFALMNLAADLACRWLDPRTAARGAL
jgi:peptide/nickel transport system permease protein